MNMSEESNLTDLDSQISQELEEKKKEADTLYRAANYYLYSEGALQEDEALAINKLEEAAKLGHPDANFLMGFYHEWGLHVGKNPRKARAYYEKAKVLGNEKADKGICGLNNPPEMFITEVERLADDYDKNPFNADSLYKEKTVRVGGKIAKIDRDIWGIPYIVLHTEDPYLPTVECHFDKGNSRDLAELSPGSGVAIQGKVEGLSIGNSVVLRDCWVVYDI